MQGWIARAGQHGRLSGGLHHNTGWKVNERPTHPHTHTHTHIQTHTQTLKDKVKPIKILTSVRKSCFSKLFWKSSWCWYVARGERGRERVRRWETVKAEPVLVSRLVVWYTAVWTTWVCLRPCLHVSDNLMSIIIHRSSITGTHVLTHMIFLLWLALCLLFFIIFTQAEVSFNCYTASCAHVVVISQLCHNKWQMWELDFCLVWDNELCLRCMDVPFMWLTMAMSVLHETGPQALFMCSPLSWGGPCRWCTYASFCLVS